jgi:hypothetical protein
MSFPSAGVPSTVVTWRNAVTGSGEPLNGLVEFATAADLNFPAATPPTRFEGPAVTEVVNGVMTPVTLPDCQHALGTAFSYTVTVRAEGAAPYQVTTSAITGSTVDLSAAGL